MIFFSRSAQTFGGSMRVQVARRFGGNSSLFLSAAAAFFWFAQTSSSVCAAEHATRTISVEASEVTRPDVTVSPDGNWLVFTALGHLFRVSESGGTAKQLTFGHWYDSDPAISPDGGSIVFASDRDGENNGNLFLLDVESTEIRQLTDENWAARPVWSPDGRWISYLSYERRGHWSEYEFVGQGGLVAAVRQFIVSDGRSVTLTKNPSLIRSVFYLPDGRVGWTVLGGTPGQPRAHDDGVYAQPDAPVSQIHVADATGNVSRLIDINGVVDRIVAGDDGLYVRRYRIPASGFLVPQPEEIAHVPLPGGDPRSISQLLSPQPRPGFGISGGNIYLGEAGKLWRIDSPSGEREAIAISASIEMTLHSPDAAPKYAPAAESTPTSILDPRLSPDGRSLVFTAAGFVWTQDPGGGAAKRINNDSGFQWGAAAYSPDGKRIAYQHSEGNLQQLRVADLETGATKAYCRVCTLLMFSLVTAESSLIPIRAGCRDRNFRAKVSTCTTPTAISFVATQWKAAENPSRSLSSVGSTLRTGASHPTASGSHFARMKRYGWHGSDVELSLLTHQASSPTTAD